MSRRGLDGLRPLRSFANVHTEGAAKTAATSRNGNSGLTAATTAAYDPPTHTTLRDRAQTCGPAPSPLLRSDPDTFRLPVAAQQTLSPSPPGRQASDRHCRTAC